jgi:hypothetical protein
VPSTAKQEMRTVCGIANNFNSFRHDNRRSKAIVSVGRVMHCPEYRLCFRGAYSFRTLANANGFAKACMREGFHVQIRKTHYPKPVKRQPAATPAE